jgi:hypothetical protein
MLALDASISWLGVLMGQRYRLAQGPDTRSNIYILGVAESGAGKDWQRKCIKRLAHELGILDYVSEEARSDAGIQAQVWRCNATLYLIDEVGAYLEAVLNSRGSNPFFARVMDKFTTLWSSADSVVPQGDKAEAKNPDVAQMDIVQPCVGIFGTKVPGRLWRALGSGNFEDGSIPRFLLFDVGDHLPNRNREAGDLVSGIDTILADCWAILAMGEEPTEVAVATARELVRQPIVPGERGGFEARPKMTPQPCTVGFDPEARKLDDGAADFEDALLRQHKGKPTAAVVARYYEQVQRLSLIAAVAADPSEPVVRVEHVRWAEAVVRWSVGRMLEAVGQNVADTREEADHKKVLDIVRKLSQAQPPEADGWVPLWPAPIGWSGVNVSA